MIPLLHQNENNTASRRGISTQYAVRMTDGSSKQDAIPLSSCLPGSVLPLWQLFLSLRTKKAGPPDLSGSTRAFTLRERQRNFRKYYRAPENVCAVSGDYHDHSGVLVMVTS